MRSKKQRRHSGRVTPDITLSMKYCKIHDSAFEPQIFWDDWTDYRDGMRYSRDKTKLRSKISWWAAREDVKRYNAKNKKLLKRRVARKLSKFMERKI